ncbi:tripartite tricarboxylate transporter substrate binding protein [Paracandidimonas soli]|uniref:Tripartite-type tricarboxylate transporter receptor subunit TctC n=1 Tax=Paracandidimonas soli TaxID=1917182 RepID=A0A4R3UZ13_9BURK|nr:tripartite tricarboxylate transporter substrate binding protein [Paracandidimonas soli]TCU96057.1 tripartite-type tricarboxylate transporter receptor subunit TctC [Paracandidimonas soli]
MKYSMMIGLLAAAIFSGAAAADSGNFPQKQVTIVVPFPAGGTLDVLTRLLAQNLSKDWKQAVVVDNKPGAGTMIGTEYVARSAPDGHTIGMVANSFAINPALQENMRYDTARDFAPVSLLAYAPHVLVAHPGVGVGTLKEVLDKAKAAPGKLTFASFGSGTSPHLAVERLKAEAEIDVVHVPYKGQAPALTDLLGGHVQMMFANLPDVLPYIQSGELKAIAVADSQRADKLPDVPTFAEQGMADFNSNSWFGAVVPAKTPDGVVKQLGRDFERVLKLPEVRELLDGRGLQAVGMTPEDFAEYLAAEMQSAQALVKSSGAGAN